MAKFRNALPQLDGSLYLTDGGIETTLIFQEGQDLPHFAAFHLLQTTAGTNALFKYFRTYSELAGRVQAGLILESATWRASADWGTKLGYTSAQLADANRKAIALLEKVRSECTLPNASVVISGCVGPRGDGYIPEQKMSASAAEQFHSEQIEVFAGTEADMICAITMNYAEEAIGIVEAARRANMPVAISFTVETDGKLPTGQTLKEAIEQVDTTTKQYPSYYMLNCAHPNHFEHLFTGKEKWSDRIKGLRANASAKSHAELNESTELDAGNPVELGSQYAHLRNLGLSFNIMGGCCGTDHQHVEQMAKACMPFFRYNK